VRGTIRYSRDVRFDEKNEAKPQSIGWDSDLDKSSEDELEGRPKGHSEEEPENPERL